VRPHTPTAATVTVAPFVAATAVSDTMGAAEKARVDRVPTPEPDWFPRFDTAVCATFRLPLDDDEPDGAGRPLSRSASAGTAARRLSA
jgi:hypothetical protein